MGHIISYLSPLKDIFSTGKVITGDDDIYSNFSELNSIESTESIEFAEYYFS